MSNEIILPIWEDLPANACIANIQDVVALEGLDVATNFGTLNFACEFFKKGLDCSNFIVHSVFFEMTRDASLIKLNS